MPRPEDKPHGPHSGWMVALHEAIATDSVYDPGPADTPPVDDLDRVRDCLWLLERVRRGREPEVHAPKHVGRFEIIREVGRGGFGVVLLAIDPRVGRRVALKVPRAEALVSAPARRRFLREARAAGALSHPNLIPVHEVGEDGPVCYIASEFCGGPNLADWLAGRREPVSEQQATVLVEALAQGVDHAHRRGVLHRDIKPSNVLLDPLSEEGSADAVPALDRCTPRLTDFGLAKLEDAIDGETRSGAWLGTPMYMAPEQAEGRLNDIGPATDVYALGVILFELLAGVPPLRGASDVQTLQLVARGEVPRLKRLRREVSRDLDAIVSKCLDRDPARRYPSALLLADDLRRFRGGEPTLARPAGRVTRTLKWIKRRPAMAALAAVTLAAAIALSGGGWWYSGQLRAALERTELQKHETEQYLYAASVTLASQAIKTNHLGAAQDQLARWIPGAAQPDLRSAAWYYLWRELHDEERTLTGHSGDVYCVRYSPDGRLLATASQDQTARIWDAASGDCLFVLEGHQGDVNCVAFSRMGNYVATAGDDGTVRVWRTADGSPQSKKRLHKGGAFGVEFSPTVGRFLASCGADSLATITDFMTGKQLVTFRGHTATVGALTFSPDGKLLATASDDSSARLWSVSDGLQLVGLIHQRPVNCLSFSNDASFLLTGQRSKRLVRMFDIAPGADGKPQHGSRSRDCVATYDWIHAVAYHPSNDCYAVATKDGTVELRGSRDDAVVRRLRGHGPRVWSLSFSSDGRRLATASADRTVKIWNLADRSETVDDNGAVRAIALTPDGRTMARGNRNSDVAVYDVESRKQTWSVGRTYDVIGDFDGDGQRDSGYFLNGTWRLRLSGNPGDPAADNPAEQVIEFGAEDDMPVVGDWNGDGRDNLGCYRPSDGGWLLDLDGRGGAPERTCSLDRPGPLPRSLCVPVIGRWETPDRDSIGLAVAEGEGKWTFWFARGDDVEPISVTNVNADLKPIAGRWHCGRPDGWGFCDGARTWINVLPQRSAPVDAAKPAVVEKKVRVTKPQSPLDLTAVSAASDLFGNNGVREVRALAISADGRLLAVAHIDDARVPIWDLRSKQRIAVLRPNAANVVSLAFTPDQTALIAGSTSGVLTLYDAKTLEPLRQINAHEQHLLQIACPKTGRVFVTLGDGGDIKFWDSRGNHQRTLRNPSTSTADVLAVSPDGKLIAVAGSDRVARLWSAATGEKIAELAGHALGVTGAAFSPDQRCLATASDDGSIKLWDLATRQELCTLAENLGPLTAVAFAGRDLVAAGERTVRNGQTGAIHFWSAGQPGIAATGE